MYIACRSCRLWILAPTPTRAANRNTIILEIARICQSQTANNGYFSNPQFSPRLFGVFFPPLSPSNFAFVTPGVTPGVEELESNFGVCCDGR